MLAITVRDILLDGHKLIMAMNAQFHQVLSEIIHMHYDKTNKKHNATIKLFETLTKHQHSFLDKLCTKHIDFVRFIMSNEGNLEERIKRLQIVNSQSNIASIINPSSAIYKSLTSESNDSASREEVIQINDINYDSERTQSEDDRNVNMVNNVTEISQMKRVRSDSTDYQSPQKKRRRNEANDDELFMNRDITKTGHDLTDSDTTNAIERIEDDDLFIANGQENQIETMSCGKSCGFNDAQLLNDEVLSSNNENMTRKENDDDLFMNQNITKAHIFNETVCDLTESYKTTTASRHKKRDKHKKKKRKKKKKKSPATFSCDDKVKEEMNLNHLVDWIKYKNKRYLNIGEFQIYLTQKGCHIPMKIMYKMTDKLEAFTSRKMQKDGQHIYYREGRKCDII